MDEKGKRLKETGRSLDKQIIVIYRIILKSAEHGFQIKKL